MQPPAARDLDTLRGVTLNVTVLTPVAIYQSADFRLIDPASGEIVSSTSAKNVPLGYQDWNGFVTYTGLGRWEGQDVSRHIARWLEGSAKLTMDQAAEIIASQSAKLLVRVSAQTAQVAMPHTVTLAGFQNGVARASVISNFEDCFGNTRAVDIQLSISSCELHRAHRALVIVTGQGPAVARSERRALKRLAATFPADGTRIRNRLQLLNERAAAREPQRISRDCVVTSYAADGTGTLQLDRGAVNPASFPAISQGMNVGEMLGDALRSLGVDPRQVKLVGTSSGTFRPGDVAKARETCEMSVLEGDRDSRYDLTAIESGDLEVMTPGGQSEAGTVVGGGRLSPDGPQNSPWVFSDGELSVLDFEGVAVAINTDGLIAGNSFED